MRERRGGVKGGDINMFSVPGAATLPSPAQMRHCKDATFRGAACRVRSDGFKDVDPRMVSREPKQRIEPPKNASRSLESQVMAAGGKRD